MKRFPLATLSLITMSLFVGCERRETVLDIETPEGGVEVEKSGDGVEIDIKSGDRDGESIRIDIPRDNRREGEDQLQ